MRDYFIDFAAAEDMHPNVYRISAANDDDAIVRLRRFIKESGREGFWGMVKLHGDREYLVQKTDGKLIGKYLGRSAQKKTS